MRARDLLVFTEYYYYFICKIYRAAGCALLESVADSMIKSRLSKLLSSIKQRAISLFTVDSNHKFMSS